MHRVSFAEARSICELVAWISGGSLAVLLMAWSVGLFDRE
jgi:hypothetical protein